MTNNQSKINKLISQLCPDGVEFKDLGKVAKIKNGKDWKQLGEGTIPVYGTGGIMNYVDTFSYNKPTVLIPRKGSITNIFYLDKPFWNVDTIYYTEIDTTQIVPKFFYYVIKNIDLEKLDTGSGRPSLTQAILDKIQIPIPPLKIQEEIVDILDKFTQFEAELEAELEARKKQYEYYRDDLLNKKDVEYKSLGETGEFIRGNGLQKKDFTEAGVGCIHYGQIYTYYGTFTDTTKSFVSPELAKKLKKAQTGDVIVTNTSENLEDVGKAVVWCGDKEIVTGGHATIFKPKKVTGKYFAYYTQTRMFFDAKRKYAKGTKVIDVSATDMSKIKIPVPSIEEQNRIVSILDKFDALTSNISIGLPAEINARRKQYEYYRGKLLAFKELEK